MSTLALPAVALADANRVDGAGIQVTQAKGSPHRALEPGGLGDEAAQALDGELDRLDSEDGAQPDTPAAEDDAPLEGEDLITPDAGDGRDEPDLSPLSEPAPEQPGEHAEPILESEPRPEPQPPLAPDPVLPSPPPPATAPQPSGSTGRTLTDGAAVGNPPGERRDLRLRLERTESAPVQAHVAPPVASTARPPSAALAPDVPSTPPTTSTLSRPAPHRAQDGFARAPGRGRTYIVRQGDSLWSIARVVLGSDASVAGIADEVNRLWDLNRNWIATGNPDLLPVGTELRI